MQDANSLVVYMAQHCQVTSDPSAATVVTLFNDGTSATAKSRTTTCSFYEGGLERGVREQTILFTLLALRLGMPYSPFLWATTHPGHPTNACLADLEEEQRIVLDFQRYINGKPASDALSFAFPDLSDMRDLVLPLLRDPALFQEDRELKHCIDVGTWWVMDNKVRLDRAPIRKNGKPGLDITVKSATGIARFFAPTWDMVRSHKSGQINDDVYTILYEERLDRLSDEVLDWLYGEGWANGGQLTLLCFCPDDKFCHTKVLIDYLVRRFPDRFARAVPA